MTGNISLEGLITEVGRCCLEGIECSECQKEDCLIGYCKKALTTSIKQQNEFIDGGMDHIPYNDTKLYDDDTVINAIGFLLNQCKNCKLYHDEECIINVVRSSLEVILLGEPQEYKGSTLFYLSDIKSSNEEMAEKIHIAFQKKKTGGIKYGKIRSNSRKSYRRN